MANKFIYSLQKYSLLRFVIVVLFFLIIGICIAYLRMAIKKTPLILDINPKIFEKTDMITISGEYFGEEAEDSFLKIDNIVIPSTLCKEWKNNKILVSARMVGEGGVLFVIVKNIYSAPTFLPLKDNIPIVKMKETSEEAPSIESVDWGNGEIGSIIKIGGENFGTVKEDSQVVFIRGYNEWSPILLENRNAENVSYCSEKNFDFDFWSDEELHVRMPESIDSGILIVKTKNGVSNPIPFNLKKLVGTKLFKNKNKFVISLETEISGVKGEEQNSIFLRTPLPEEDERQIDFNIISLNLSPIVQNHEGEIVYQIENIKKDDKIKVLNQYEITCYEVNTNVNLKNISNKINNKKLYDQYTSQTRLIPSKDTKIKNIVNKIVKTEKNAYLNAKKIYEFIISNFEINNDITSDRSQTVISFLDNKKGSPYDASLLFCTFCRSIGIPALPIAGVVIDKQKKTYIHWWAEFYIEAFGWIPVDIGMAMSVPFENEIKDKREYYFGNIDSFRISFSHGEKEILQMVANSKMYSHERSFAFKRFWEETLGIDAYTCFWYTPQIISIN